jgi:hypothetical protein
MSEREQS